MKWNKNHADALAAIFSALDKAGIQWLVLKNHDGLPGENRSRDVDIGIRKRDFARAIEAINPCLKSFGFDHVLVEKFKYVICNHFYAYCGGRFLSLKIDLIDKFVVRGATIICFEDLFPNSRRNGEVRISATADEAFLLWIQTLLLSGEPRKKYFPRIMSAALADPEGFRSRLHRSFGSRTGDKAWELIGRGELDATARLAGRLRRAGWLRSFSRRPMRTLADTVHYYGTFVARKARRNPGTFLAVVGPDGVGKTSFIEGLGARLAQLQAGKPDAIINAHFRPHLLPNIRELLTGRKEEAAAFHNPHRAAPAGFPSSILRLGYYWADYLLGYWSVVRRNSGAGRTVIFDRYFHDFIVDPRRSRLSLPGWMPRLLLLMTPQPDLVFFLDGDPDLVFARKQELPRDEIARQLDAYRALAACDPGRFVRLDAAQAPDLIVEDALRQFVVRCYERIDAGA